MFFPLWLLGTATYWLSKKLNLSVSAGRTLILAGLLPALLGNAIVLYFHLDFGFGAQESPDLWPFYLAAILFAVTAVGFRFANITISRYTGWVQWAAGASGTLYLLHFSLGRFINGLIPFTWHPKLRWLLMVIPIIAISLLFAQFAERRREAWRKKIEAGLEKAEQAAAFLEKKRRKKLSLL
jgi:peptidoglycan/LPS O-acetylase OafA/YrhL